MINKRQLLIKKASSLTCLIIACAFPPVGAAEARSLEAARVAFGEGQFAKASELAEEVNTSDGYALAAHSLAVHGYHIAKDDEKQALFKRAMELAEKAVRLDPQNPEAHLQLAHALGRYAQSISIVEALDKDYPGKVREALEEALRLKPDMAAAHLSLGSWHAEARHSGGIIAGALFGASKKDALGHLQRALELAPDDKLTLYLYAHGLLLLDRSSNYDRARELLARAIRIPSKDAYYRITHELATGLLEDLEAHPPEPPWNPSRLGQP